MAARDGNASDGPKAKDARELQERKSEATSEETLSDIEESEQEAGSGSSKRDPGPSPDGALDESEEIKDAGPM
jgi:hypothetical protein